MAAYELAKGQWQQHMDYSTEVRITRTFAELNRDIPNSKNQPLFITKASLANIFGDTNIANALTTSAVLERTLC